MELYRHKRSRDRWTSFPALLCDSLKRILRLTRSCYRCCYVSSRNRRLLSSVRGRSSCPYDEEERNFPFFVPLLRHFDPQFPVGSPSVSSFSLISPFYRPLARSFRLQMVVASVWVVRIHVRVPFERSGNYSGRGWVLPRDGAKKPDRNGKQKKQEGWDRRCPSVTNGWTRLTPKWAGPNRQDATFCWLAASGEKSRQTATKWASNVSVCPYLSSSLQKIADRMARKERGGSPKGQREETPVAATPTSPPLRLFLLLQLPYRAYSRALGDAKKDKEEAGRNSLVHIEKRMKLPSGMNMKQRVSMRPFVVRLGRWQRTITPISFKIQRQIMPGIIFNFYHTLQEIIQGIFVTSMRYAHLSPLQQLQWMCLRTLRSKMNINQQAEIYFVAARIS